MGVPAPSYEDVTSDLRSLAASPPSSTDAGAFDAWLVAVSENVLLLSEVSEEGGASPRGEIGELSALLEEALLEESMTAAERSRTVSEVVRILYIILSR